MSEVTQLTEVTSCVAVSFTSPGETNHSSVSNEKSPRRACGCLTSLGRHRFVLFVYFISFVGVVDSMLLTVRVLRAEMFPWGTDFQEYRNVIGRKNSGEPPLRRSSLTAFAFYCHPAFLFADE